MKRSLSAVLSLAALGLSGCSLIPDVTPGDVLGLGLLGMVHGGQQPISGAHVYLFQAGTSGSAGYGIPASSANASVSLLKAANTGLSDALGAYVLTAADGSFSISGDYTCTPGTQVYVYVQGGNPGAGINTAVGLMAILGNCPSADNFAATVPYLWVNEVSTIAAAYAMAGYATDSTHVSSSGTALAKVGIQNAFANAANLASISTGTALATNPANTAIVPQKTINTLANILTACVNSPSATSSICSSLFTNATNNGVVPTDTGSAAINIAHNPTANVSNLFSIPTPAVAFAPALTTVPNDFSLAVTYTLPSLAGADGIAIDASGDAWISNYNTNAVVKLSPAGASLASITGSNFQPGAIAIDNLGNAWVANANSIAKINSAATSASYFYSSLNNIDTFFGMAVDGTGNLWTSDSFNYTLSTIEKISSSGGFFHPNGYAGAGLDIPTSVAVDGGGNVWATNVLGPVVSKLSSTGASASGTNGFLGTGIFAGASVAIDSLGNAWVANTNGSVTKLSNSGTLLSGSTGYTGGGIDTPQAIAIDGAGSAWIASLSALTELSNSGTKMTGANGIAFPIATSNYGALAIDGSGDVWIANLQGSNGITELIGAAAPVVTPIAAGLPATPNVSGASNLGTRP